MFFKRIISSQNYLYYQFGVFSCLFWSPSSILMFLLMCWWFLVVHSDLRMIIGNRWCEFLCHCLDLFLNKCLPWMERLSGCSVSCLWSGYITWKDWLWGAWERTWPFVLGSPNTRMKGARLRWQSSFQAVPPLYLRNLSFSLSVSVFCLGVNVRLYLLAWLSLFFSFFSNNFIKI